MTRVLVLAGGPDAEREVSLQSGAGVADAARRAGLEVVHETIGRPSVSELRALIERAGAQAVFPALHGPWGEGGPLQDMLETIGVAYVGCRSHAARLAMDKLATKLFAAQAGVPTLPAAVLNPLDDVCPLALPVVVKPVHEGSSVGLHLCPDRGAWARALAAVRDAHHAHPHRTSMVERMVRGVELTVGVLGGEALPVVRIEPASGVYDYDAKYVREDTRYSVAPELPDGVSERVRQDAISVARALGVRHLCRVDFLMEDGADGVRYWLLEANTMPGFTSHSLLPMAAAHAGLDMPALVRRLVEMATHDAGANGRNARTGGS
ncbi:MAG: D-alanine--D-alanine ligase [Phycisphaerales bacterium]|jgi:D-alanine-D-alanine ligase|nr:D-alanine--D-alanine ligase [Phycisphaerales bacterium]